MDFRDTEKGQSDSNLCISARAVGPMPNHPDTLSNNGGRCVVVYGLPLCPFESLCFSICFKAGVSIFIHNPLCLRDVGGSYFDYRCSRVIAVLMVC